MNYARAFWTTPEQAATKPPVAADVRAADGATPACAVPGTITGTITARERADLVRSLRRFTRDADLAEDCFQSAFVRLEEYRRTQEVQSDVRFLARAARNIAIDEARKNRVRTATAGAVRCLIEDAHNGQLLPDEALVVRERLAVARGVLDALPERTRTIFLLHRFTRTRYRDIAAQFGISVSAVEKHVARAAQALARLAQQDDERIEA